MVLCGSRFQAVLGTPACVGARREQRTLLAPWPPADSLSSTCPAHLGGTAVALGWGVAPDSRTWGH